jgi:hypothetical protein
VASATPLPGDGAMLLHTIVQLNGKEIQEK